uniref:Uncharacterized protein n=1 Tax=Rhizophora mucronata TaxID=61149 RepID=A0A2P2N548_RHIMU
MDNPPNVRSYPRLFPDITTVDLANLKACE